MYGTVWMLFLVIMRLGTAKEPFFPFQNFYDCTV
jgi:hypothetical protein